ncbi:hypothetical protein L596_003576 [Steinernema carpocapsae]|uniref:Transmembrane protein n=1 Tax=Steinernema carpocapsae TaxID=34508 RepID=A0A4U8UU30_STECR|nr:hypothetical protein L596_003576 [Steinernema carpocapsae]
MNRSAATDDDQVPNVFIQKQNEFLRKGSQNYQRWMSEETAVGHLESETVSVAISVQNTFHSVTMVLQGFLSGFCAAHVFISFSYVQNEEGISFDVVSPYIQSVLYVCFTLSAIAAFDRFETGPSFKENIKRALLMQHGGLAICIWMLGNVANLLATTSEQLVFSDQPVDNLTFGTVNVWRYLCVARACLAILGWLLMALQPNHNHLRQRLLAIKGK